MDQDSGSFLSSVAGSINAMGILWKISKWYNRYQFLMWAVGSITAIAAPLIGYATYFLGINNQRAELVSDSPEYANDITAGNLIQWLTGQAHSYGRILGIIAIIGTLLIIFCITFTIIGWIGRRTEISGTDQSSEIQEKGRRKAETEEQYDDYGQPAEY
ncbi:hypothetical protein GBJ32_06885 [Bifidobacterium longum]|jgi:hypothetical protein|uniref:Uncharacterized protein n=3 Tax=Bifidobacterium longum TaxID=216816 RepID=A0A6G0GXP2_BIFLN|nr:hypothetical protein HMPREF1313_1387 [Bifidobacterium longum subsp. longum 1-6B]EIJ30258.1 hypothetical protein HMPREF1312_0800 [Bifidobacterium longum subsp. longum 44B]KAB7020145.1 hypothetical protein GBJ29_06885 [Bifidobacterium longum]MZL55889.1 hypothetical protein [Bifidobacterium pseudocatenulatum]KAB7026264.1 hypothetical protein GBJ23_07235 [Bifidobacterium longum]